MYQQLLWNFRVIVMRRKRNCVKYHHAALFLYLVVYWGYPPASIIRSKVQRKHVQRMIKPSLIGYRSKTGGMDKLKHDSQTSLQPLLLSVWGAVLREQWGALVIEMHSKFNSHCFFLRALDANPFSGFALWNDLILCTSLLALKLLFISWIEPLCYLLHIYICCKEHLYTRDLAVSIHLGLCAISVH